MNLITEFVAAYWKSGFEILLLAALFYYLLLLFRGTRGAAIFSGLIFFLLTVILLSQYSQLTVIDWILGRVLQFLAIALLVIFQPELRRALAQLGSQQLFGSPQQRGKLIDVLVETTRSLSQKRCGALMAVEREIGFRGVAETGVAVDSKATPELLATIFFPNTPLHDGGVILRGDRIVAAGCVFPLTHRQGLSTNVGMRHRAAIGLTEETDAIAIAVSEETGQISIAHRGNLVQGLDPTGLRAFLTTTLTPSARPGNWLVEGLRRLFGTMLLPRNSTGETPAADGFSETPITSVTEPNEPSAPDNIAEEREARRG